MSGRPKICVRCQKLMGVADTCPYCGTKQGAASARILRGAAAGSSGLSVKIVILLAFFHIVAIALDGVLNSAPGSFGFEGLDPTNETLFRLGAMTIPAVWAGQWWRLIMAIFLHGGILHLAFNAYFTWRVGADTERDAGGWVFYLVYFVSGVVGFLGNMILNDLGGITIGASGAVAGILGWLLTRRRMMDGNFSHPTTQGLVRLIGLNVLIGFVMPGINVTAHGFGFAAGIAMAYFFSRGTPSRARAVVLMLASWGAVAVTALAMVMMVLAVRDGGPTNAITAQDCWIQVTRMSGQRWTPDEARLSLKCLAKLPRLEAPANAAAEEALAALNQASLAWAEDGEGPRIRTARLALTASATDWFAWQREAYPRYNLHMRSSAP